MLVTAYQKSYSGRDDKPGQEVARQPNKTKTGTLRERTLDRAIRAACKVDNEASRDRGIAPSGLRVGDCLTAGAVEGRYFVTTSSAVDGVGKRVAAQGFPVRVFDPF